MRKSYKYILSIVLMNILNITFWVCNYYPRHLFEVSLSSVAMIINILYFIVYDYVLIIIFTQNRIPLFEANDFHFETGIKKFHIKEFLVLFGIQAVFEVLNNISYFLISLQWQPIASDLLIVISWISVYLFLAAKNYEKKPTRTKLLIFTLLFVIVVGASIFFDIKTAQEYIFAINKYTLLSPQIMQFYKNQQFLYSIKSLILDGVIVSLLLVYHFSNQAISTREKKRSDVPALIVQIIVLFTTVSVLYVLKVIVYPDSMIKNYNLRSTQEISHINEGHLDISTENFMFYRGVGRSDTDLRFQNNKTKVGKGKNQVEFYWMSTEDFYILDENESSSPVTPNSIVLPSLYNEYVIDGSKVYLYRKDAISFCENGECQILLLKKLDSFEKNETVIKLLEILLSKGNVFAFEYGRNYLLEYDRDFIEPYIERYVAGDFTENELTWLEKSCYQKDYIINIAKQPNMQ